MLILKGRRRGGDMLAFSPDGRALAARSETGLQLWRDISSGAKPVVVRDITSAGYLRFTPDGTTLYIDGRFSGTIDVASATFTPFPARDGYRLTALTADGESLSVVNLPDSGQNTLVCWPAAKPFIGKPRWRVKLPVHFAGRPLALPGVLILHEEGDGTARRPRRQYRYTIRSATDGKLLSAAPFSEWRSEREAVSACGRWLAAQHTNRVTVWNLNKLTALPATWDSGSKKIFTDLAFHPSGEFLAVTCNDGTVRFHETGTWSLARTFTWNLGKMTGIALSADGALAAAGSDTGKIVVWDVDS
jgi:WD40 repeat protein